MALNKNREKCKSFFFFILANKTKFKKSYLSYLPIYILMISTVLIFGQTSKFIDLNGLVHEYFLLCYDSIRESGSKVIHLFRNQVELSKENLALVKLLGNQDQLREQLDKIEQENLALKKHIHLNADMKNFLISAKLISAQHNVYRHTGLITVGKDDGIKANQIVVTSEGLLGKISDIGQNYSKISLVTDVSMRIPVITTISKQKCILRGINDLKLTLAYLSDKNALVEGELLVTYGEDSYYPPAIPVAKIINKEAFPVITAEFGKIVSVISNIEN